MIMFRPCISAYQRRNEATELGFPALRYSSSWVQCLVRGSEVTSPSPISWEVCHMDNSVVINGSNLHAFNFGSRRFVAEVHIDHRRRSITIYSAPGITPSITRSLAQTMMQNELGWKLGGGGSHGFCYPNGFETGNGRWAMTECASLY